MSVKVNLYRNKKDGMLEFEYKSGPFRMSGRFVGEVLEVEFSYSEGNTEVVETPNEETVSSRAVH